MACMAVLDKVVKVVSIRSIVFSMAEKSRVWAFFSKLVITMRETIFIINKTGAKKQMRLRRK